MNYTTFRHLSLDIALGAIASGGLVVWFLKISMPVAWWFVLPASIWLIYTADHLLDVKQLGTLARTPRHIFHRTHFPTLYKSFWILLVITVLIAFLGLPAPILFFGALMAFFIGIYFLAIHVLKLQKTLWFQKETVVAVLYAIGVWGGPLAMRESPLTVLELILIFQMMLVALMNLLLFAYHEFNIEQLNLEGSWLRRMGQDKVRNLIYMTGFLVFLIIFLLFKQVTPQSLLVMGTFGVMAAILMVVLKYEDTFQKQERYRVAGDAVFILPILPVLLDYWFLNL